MPYLWGATGGWRYSTAAELLMAFDWTDRRPRGFHIQFFQLSIFLNDLIQDD